ncbi:hypothetical protein [Rhodoferax antarcticus]|uniref:DUF736 domain-containing protein n=1 Tax=Rhodoferax antarcticus ANT.BR TaxID=1111071 RepID=A0A1Q8Y922_9BURK|nr:hypothetical protein [Rhodoferax antarcticus]OLP04498.1 hypothetical protein BLL52_4184 [Rhodoferax antarcticus ANT.BR]
MSKQNLLRLANFNVFQNTNEKIEFSLSKDNRVQAQYSGYDKDKGYDVRGVRQKSAAGKGYIRLSVALIDGESRSYFNGALFKNDKKTELKQPDFRGSLNLDNQQDGPKLSLAAWIKQGEKAGDYLSIAISEFQDQGSAPARQPAPAHGNSFDMDDDAPPARQPAPAQRSAPARQPAPAARQPAPARQASPAQRSGAAQAPAPSRAASGFDDMDDDIPFIHYHSDSTQSNIEGTFCRNSRKMARYNR